MLAYHGKTELKDGVLALMREHREADKLVKGKYWENGKGCAVGCTLESIRRINGWKTISWSSHALYEKYLGVPRVLAKLEDGLFESLPNGDSQAWPERFLNAIRPGADLSMVWPKFLHNLLTDPEGGVQQGASRREDVRKAVTTVADLFGVWIETGQQTDAAAAYAAAASASASSAANASDAAGTRERQRQANVLIQLLSEA